MLRELDLDQKRFGIYISSKYSFEGIFENSYF